MKTTADLKEGIKLMESTDNSMLLDVRSPGEYSEGHLKGSINIPLDTLPKAVMDGLIPKDKTLFADVSFAGFGAHMPAAIVS